MLNLIYNQKVTILNKLKRDDSSTGLDVWHKTVLNDAAWYPKSEHGVSGTSVLIGSYFKVLIPFHDEYLDYAEWRKAGNQDGHYTMSIGDYVILGELDSEDEITAQNIVKLMTKYEPNVCLVKHFEPTHKRFNAHVQLMIEGA